MPPHLLPPLLSLPLDSAHSAVALMIGVAGGFFLAEIRLEPLRRALKRKPRPPTNPNDPWS
ncbi:MAG TPA: hypothetical protein VIJ59_05955 [Caulobacteraceae bacterium]